MGKKKRAEDIDSDGPFDEVGQGFLDWRVDNLIEGGPPLGMGLSDDPLPPEFEGDEWSMAYVQARAVLALRDGITEKTRKDLLARGGRSLLAAVEQGLQKVADGQGFTPRTCLTGVGIPGFYAMLRILQLGFAGQRIVESNEETVLDEMIVQHPSREWTVRMYNRVPKPKRRGKRKGKDNGK